MASMNVESDGFHDRLRAELYFGGEYSVRLDETDVTDYWEREESMEDRTEAIRAFAVHARDLAQHASNTGTDEEQVACLRIQRLMGELEREPSEEILRSVANRIEQGA